MLEVKPTHEIVRDFLASLLTINTKVIALQRELAAESDTSTLTTYLRDINRLLDELLIMWRAMDVEEKNAVQARFNPISTNFLAPLRTQDFGDDDSLNTLRWITLDKALLFLPSMAKDAFMEIDSHVKNKRMALATAYIQGLLNKTQAAHEWSATEQQLIENYAQSILHDIEAAITLYDIEAET